MAGTKDLVYAVIRKQYDGQLVTRAICTCEDEYNDYKSTHDMTNCKTIVINPDNPKMNKHGDFMDSIYDSSYAIVDYYDGIPLTQEEEQMLIEQESTFHQFIKGRLFDVKISVDSNIIRFDKHEMAEIDKMLTTIREKCDGCMDEDCCSDYDPTQRINYGELIKWGKIVR